MLSSKAGRALLYTAAFLFLATWVVSIASTSVQDWWWLWTTTIGPREGLWSTCFNNLCVPANQYSGGCQSLLNAVRAFSILTILFGFFTMVFILALLSRESTWLWVTALVLAILTVCFSVLPWTIYFGFFNQCVVFSATKGSGWSLAVAAFPIAVVGLLFLVLWVALAKGYSKANAGQGMVYYPPQPTAYVTMAPPMVAAATYTLPPVATYTAAPVATYTAPAYYTVTPGAQMLSV